MKAYCLTSYDGPAALTLTDVAPPVPADGDLLVDVTAIGVNFPDLLMTRGQYQVRPDLPCVPGCEVAGVVRRAPHGSGWQQGDQVTAFVWRGGYAEQVLIPVETAARIPDSIGPIVAAATTVNYQTVMFALDRRARLEAGEKVLVLGAAGGIGTAAIQIAKGLGARVIAGVAHQGQAAIADAAGADEVVILEPGFSSPCRTAGRGVDVVVDPLGDWLFDEALRCLEPEGRLLVVGFAAGAIPSLAVNRLLLRNVSVVGAAFGAFLDLEPGLVESQARRIFALADQGVVKPQIDRVVGFEELPAALEALGRGEVRGKAVVTVQPRPDYSNQQLTTAT